MENEMKGKMSPDHEAEIRNVDREITERDVKMRLDKEKALSGEKLKEVKRESDKMKAENEWLNGDEGKRANEEIDDIMMNTGRERGRMEQMGVMKAYRTKLRDEQLKNKEMIAKVQYGDSQEAIQNDLVIADNMRMAEHLRLNTKAQKDYLKSAEEYKKMQREKQLLGERVTGYISADEQLEIARTVNDEMVKVENEKGQLIREIMGMFKQIPQLLETFRMNYPDFADLDPTQLMNYSIDDLYTIKHHVAYVRDKGRPNEYLE